ncbi:hypothetical protein O9992_03345 [Vibrio lentus]|nr:hypothetical protein [Vibrio lentus]
MGVINDSVSSELANPASLILVSIRKLQTRSVHLHSQQDQFGAPLAGSLIP